MYAIVQVGSSQYKVSEGDNIETQLLDKEAGASIHLEEVLLLADGDNLKVGQPYLKDVTVEAKVIRQFLADKVISFKFRRRKDSKWTKGHRQKLTLLNITKIKKAG
jgi:large subunit ribosomal protein L21